MRSLKRKLTEEEVARIEELAGQGLTAEQIAECLGVKRITLWRWSKRSDVGAALERGRVKMYSVATGKLKEKIMEGNTSAIIFYLKTRWGWKEQSSVDVTSSDGSLSPADTSGVKIDFRGMDVDHQLEALKTMFGQR